MRGILIMSFGVLFAPPTYAMVEVRGNYGLSMAKPDGFNAQYEHAVKNAPDVEAPKMMGLDAIYVSTVKGLLAGLRYETGTFEKSGPATISGTAVTTTVKYKSSRISLLGGMRFVDRPAGYFGALAHYAVSQSGEFKSSSLNGGGSTSTSAYKAELAASYGAGLEAGARFKHVVFGAETGYVINKVDRFSDADGVVLDATTLKTLTMDLSGVYLKATIGYAF